jgi:sporulation protein YlmC with PRC-barrel domain
MVTTALAAALAWPMAAGAQQGEPVQEQMERMGQEQMERAQEELQEQGEQQLQEHMGQQEQEQAQPAPTEEPMGEEPMGEQPMEGEQAQQDQPGQPEAQGAIGREMPEGETGMEGGYSREQLQGMLGLTVVNAEGDRYGEVYDILMSDAGNVEQVVIQSGGFLGFGDRLVAVPSDRVDMSPDRQLVTVMMTMEEFETAQEFEYSGAENTLREEQ